MIAAFGDDEIARHIRHRNRAGESAPGAECIIINDGLITYTRFVFDQAPPDATRKASNGADTAVGARHHGRGGGLCLWYRRVSPPMPTSIA